VLIQEIWGVNAHIRAVADQYAMDGYVVLAPDVFWRQEPGVDLDYDPTGTQKAYRLMQNLDGPNAVKDLAAAAGLLRARSEVTGKIGVAGFCMGGRLSYQLAATGAVDTAVCYYGGGIQGALDVAPKIAVPILFHYAALDAHIPLTAVDAVKAAFASHHSAQFYIYEGVDHGFNCWGRPMYNQRAAALARGRTLEWLSAHLG
jgi:carboxymethylenebutenolidase